MTDHHDTTGDVHALSGAYAVDALDPDERLRFEAHLRECPACQAEVAGLREAVAMLGGDAAVAPPAGLRASVLAGIETVRPLPPVTALEPTAEVRPLRPRRRFLGLAGPQLALAAAAVLVVVAAVGGVWLWQGSDDDAPELTAAEQVLTAADAVHTTRQFPDGSSATVYVSRSEGRAVIVTDDMAPAPTGKDYQLWLVGPDGSMVPDLVMPDDPDTTKVLEGDASEVTAVGITVEPDGGSEEPSTEPLAVIQLGA